MLELKIHWPDRYVPLFGAPPYDIKNEREFVPFEEQLRGMEDVIKAGKVGGDVHTEIGTRPAGAKKALACGIPSRWTKDSAVHMHQFLCNWFCVLSGGMQQQSSQVAFL